MLFSDKKIASFIQSNFEPVWVSLRPVPLVTINFGNGIILRRTLHGNIASFVCNSQAEVLDVLPGLYEPQTYMDSLNRLSQLHRAMKKRFKKKNMMTVLRRHHEAQLKNALQTVSLARRKAKTLVDAIKIDTKINEDLRRPMIHKHLLERSWVTPGSMTKWLYREVLGADLDDPYMGLKDTAPSTKGKF